MGACSKIMEDREKREDPKDLGGNIDRTWYLIKCGE